MKNPASWIIRKRSNGAVMQETFNPKAVEHIRATPLLDEAFECVPIGEYLASLNANPSPA